MTGRHLALGRPRCCFFLGQLCTLFAWSIFKCCQARDVVVCSTGEHTGHAARSNLFDFEENKLHFAWFETASLTPLPDSGGCDIVRLPAYEATAHILRGVDLQIHTIRLQLRKYFQLVAHPHVDAPHVLLGKSVAVFQATEMHVFLLQAITVFSLSYREVSRQDLLEGGLVLSEQSVTIVLCNDVAEVEALYSAHLVDAEVVPHGGSTDYINPDEVLFTTEDLHRWDRTFSYLMVTSRKWAQDPTNMRVLQYFTAVTEVYDAHFGIQTTTASSPEITYLVDARLALLGFTIVKGEIQGVSQLLQLLAAGNLAANVQTYFYFRNGERFWEDHMNQMVDKTIVKELVANSKLFLANGWSTRHMEAAEFDRYLNLQVFDGLEAVIQNVTQSFNWTLGQTPGVQRPPLPFGAWNNWPPPDQAHFCSGTLELPSNASGSFSDGHIGRGQYAPNSNCDWLLPQPQPLSSDDARSPPPVLVEFPLLFLEPMSEKDTVQVVDPRAPHRLLAHFRGQVVGGAVRHAGPLAVLFRSNAIRRVNMMELEMGLNASYSHLGCGEDPRGCGEGTCGDDGVCVCPEGRSGVDCHLEHCLGTNVYELQPGESVTMRSNVAATYPSFADCRWEVHPPADCAACVVDVVFTSLHTELGRDAVQVATAPSSEAFWWDQPPNSTMVYTRSDLNVSGLRVRGLPGTAVFVRLRSDEVMEGAGFEATARVLDSSQAPGGASTFNCYDAQGGQPCSGQGMCVPGLAEGEMGHCVCESGYFGRTCEDEVCHLANVAPTLPIWRLAHANRQALIARNSECQWSVAPAPLLGNGSGALPVASVRVIVQEWDFEGTRNNELTLSSEALEVKLQTNRCVSDQACRLEAQCSRLEGTSVGACNWTAAGNTLEMPPEFTLDLHTGINTNNAHIALVVQATFMTPSGHVVVAEETDPTAIVCEPKPGQGATPLVFDFTDMDCILPPEAVPASKGSDNSFLVVVLVPMLAVLFMVAVVLIYRNYALSRNLANLKSERMRLNPEAPDIDLDSPLVKVTKYLGNAAKKQPFLARWLLPKNNMAEQAEELKAMLLEADNVHRPKIDMQHLQDDYGQDIVDFILASTNTRRYTPEDALAEVMVNGTRSSMLRHAASHTSDSDSSVDKQCSVSSNQSTDGAAFEMTEDDKDALTDTGLSYDVDLSCLYIRELKGTLCFVGLKVMEDWDLMSSLKISRSKMASYLLAVEDGYLDNPYHNVYHAADVTNRLATMFSMSGLADHLRETHKGRIQLLGVVLAAAVHDYGHPGTNNAYAVKTSQLYAKIYNDQAVYENSALYQSLSLTDNAELDFSARFSQETKRLLRVTIIELVLSTDMSRHFDMVTMVKTKMTSALAKAKARQSAAFLESRPSGFASKHEDEAQVEKQGLDLNDLSAEQLSLITQFALKVADIGHCMLPLDQHKFWVGNLEKEFFSQGDREKEAGLPISPLMDRTKPGPTSGGNQAGFFEVIVLPTIGLWQALFPGSADQLHQQALSNLTFWKISGHLDQQSELQEPAGRNRSFVVKKGGMPANVHVGTIAEGSSRKQSRNSEDDEDMGDGLPADHIKRSLSARD